MENNKFRDMTQVPANGAVEDELKVQDVDAGAPGLSEEDSAKIDEIVETLEAEESVEEAAKAIEPAMSEADMRKAQVAETKQAIEKANQEIATSKEVFSRASKERADAKKALANQKKQVKEAIRKEKRQKRQEAATKSKEERHAELERRKAALVHTTAEMSTKMKQLLSGELKSMEKRKKTRAAEIMAVFANHNFYANGFTPVELRTTLEDLGPTYVKIGQIMSSRVDMLPELDLSALLTEVTDLASKHNISMPGKYTMLVRSIATIEGVIEQLCPELNLFQQITDRILERVKQSFDVKQELISAGKDALEMGKKVSKMPGLAYDALNNAVKGRMKVNFELTGYEEILRSLNATTKNVVLALFACVLFIGSALLSSADIQPKTPHGQPLVAAAGMIFSIALGIYTVRRMSKKK